MLDQNSISLISYDFKSECDVKPIDMFFFLSTSKANLSSVLSYSYPNLSKS